MICAHNPVIGIPIYVALFAMAIVVAFGKAIFLMIVRPRKLELPLYVKPFFCFSLGMVSIIFAFYFLLRCITHNWICGYPTGLEHELRSSDFGFAGLLWFASMLLIFAAIRLVAQSKR